MANIKKISVATVYGKIDLKKLMAAPGEELPIMRILGSAVAIKTGQSSYGEWTSLQGMFEAIHSETGEVSQSSTLFLPDVALTPIMVQLSQHGVQGVEFAIEIGVRYAETKKAGGVPYEYTFRPLLPPDENDPISRLKNKLLALEAPKDTPAPTPAPVAGSKARR